jgi:succinate dehydrogenase hydrophobic anchor subunit
MADRTLTSQQPLDTASIPLAGVVLSVLAGAGYGLWLLIGLALAAGVYVDGRGEVLAPLVAGMVLVSGGLLASCLRMPGARLWHGWEPTQGSLPTIEGLVAMGAYLPMLAVAGLARGSNDFWATRVAGLALAVLCLATLLQSARNACRRDGMPAPMPTLLPLAMLVAALLAGGLCLWLCVVLETSERNEVNVYAARVFVLIAALASGLLDSLRWRALLHGAAGRLDAPTSEPLAAQGRLAAAVLGVGVPCVLAVVGSGPLEAAAAAVAALSCVIGQCLGQRLFCAAHARIRLG